MKHQVPQKFMGIFIVLGTAALTLSTFVIPIQLAGASKASPPSTGVQLLPDIRPEKSTLADNDLVKDPQTGHVLLRFAAGVSNYASGKLEVVGIRESSDSNDTLTAYQRVYNADGTYTQVAVGKLIYHPAHHHWHFANAVEFRLIDPSTKSGNVIMVSQKQSFCLADVAVVDETVTNYPTQPIYNRCYNMPPGITDFVLMGVSPGWEDVYGKDLVGQSMDVTDLMQKPAKTYILEEITNPAGVLKDVHNGTPQVTSVEVTIGQGVPVGTGVTRPGV